MTTRNSVSIIQNRWYDGQRVDQQDLVTDQTRNVGTDAAIINNHFGSGVLPNASLPVTVFDTDNLLPDQVALIASGDFDGTGLEPIGQPSDTSNGNQLSVELMDSDLNGPSTAFGRMSTKVLIIGLDFQGSLQYERFYFYKKEKQVSQKHYAKVLCVFFNDFIGNTNCSRDLGGRVVIKEANSFELSRDPVMTAQDTQPNIFFRDFKISTFSGGTNPTVTLYQALQAGIGNQYSVDGLNITTTALENIYLPSGDVTTKIGQKFLALTNNIQKISLLLGVDQDTTTTTEHWFDWSGELIVSVYALQTTVSSPSDLVPTLAIEFDPAAQPITQFSLNQQSLRDLGYVLNNVAQPIDLVFSASPLGSSTNSVITVGQYYAVVINRAGDASTGSIFAAAGATSNSDTRVSIYSGLWTDIPQESLWFQVWTDAAKVSDGQGYDSGNGIQIPKTIQNSSGAYVDYSFGLNQFSDTGHNTLNTAIIEAVLTQSQQEQDERTGSPVYSRQQYTPSLSFVTNSTLQTIQETGNPLIIGSTRDTNPISNYSVTGTQPYPGLVKGDTYTLVAPDPSVIAQNLIGSKLIPNDDCAGLDYRIMKVSICTDGYGDVNGDGVIDEADANRAIALIGESLSSASTQQKIIDGYISTLEILRADVNGNGIVDAYDAQLIASFIARDISTFPYGRSFQHVEFQVQQSIGRYDGYFDCDGYIRLDGYIGQNKIDPASLGIYAQIYDGYIIPPQMDKADPAWTTVPYVPVPFLITPQAFWQDYQVQFSSATRMVPAVFTSQSGGRVSTSTVCTSPSITSCSNVTDIITQTDPGKNDIFIPDNLIIRGNILNVDGTFYKQDFEVKHFVLELPPEVFSQASIDVFHKLVADAGDGFTSAGYPAMRYSDCTTVGLDALIYNRLRFGVSIQSIVPNLDGYSVADGYGVIVDDLIGIYMDPIYGIMTITAKDLDEDLTKPNLITKIEIVVYAKKAGWQNTTQIIPPNQIMGLVT